MILNIINDNSAFSYIYLQTIHSIQQTHKILSHEIIDYIKICILLVLRIRQLQRMAFRNLIQKQLKTQSNYLLVSYFYFLYYQIDCQQFIQTRSSNIIAKQLMQNIELNLDQNCTFKNVLKELKQIKLALKECGFSNQKIQAYIQTSISDFDNQKEPANFTQTLINRLKMKQNRQHFLNRMLIDLHVLRLSLTEEKDTNSNQVKNQKGEVKKKKKQKKVKKQSTTAIINNAQADQQNIFKVPAKMIITDKSSQFQNLQMQKAELRQNLMKIHMFKQFLQKELIMQMMGEKLSGNLTLTQMWGFPSIQNHCR